MSELRERLDFAVAIALEAGAYVMRSYRAPGLTVDSKADASPVTDADRGAEELVRQRLARAAPADAITGEEFGEAPGTSGFRWYIDPIDGTQSFIRGVPLFGTMLAVEQDGEAAAGVIVFPALREAVYAAKGAGAWAADGVDLGASAVANPAPAAVSETAALSEATLSQTSTRIFDDHGLSAAYARASRAVRTVRGWGDCYGHYLVATGRIDAMLDPELKAWDTAPLKPIIEGAGGRFTDWGGAPTIYGESGISTNGRIHDALLAALRG